MRIEFNTLFSDIPEDKLVWMTFPNAEMEKWQLDLIKKMKRFCIPWSLCMLIMPISWSREETESFRNAFQKALDNV